MAPPVDTTMMPDPKTGEMVQVIAKYYNDIFHNEFFTDKLNMPLNANFGYSNLDITSKNLIKKAAAFRKGRYNRGLFIPLYFR